MKSFIRFIKTKSLFFSFTIERNQKKEIKTLRLYKKFAKNFLKKTSLTKTFLSLSLLFPEKRKENKNCNPVTLLL